MYSYFETSRKGLNDDEIEARGKQFGTNEISRERRDKGLVMFIKTFFNPFIGILIALALVSTIIDVLLAEPDERDWTTVLIISTMVLISAVLRFSQEWKSSKASEALRKMVKNTASVYRNGSKTSSEVNISDLVPGDIVYLAAGDMIPADLRIVESKDLFLSQSSLTGESDSIEKSPDLLDNSAKTGSVVELDNICFMGSNVVSGSAIGVVFATGQSTYLGTIAKSIVGVRAQTSFDKGINKISFLLIRFMLVMVPFVFLINGITKGDWLEALIFAVSVAVGLTPEMLPMIVTGGTLIFGLKEFNSTSNEIVGLSNDFRIVEIVKNAISLLTPIPAVTYDWIKNCQKNIFVIQVEKADSNILLDKEKYIRVGTDSISESAESQKSNTLGMPNYKNTVAIIISIENYKPRNNSTIKRVDFANNDAIQFKQVLIEVMKMQEEDIHVFSDENALKSDLENDLKYIYRNLSEDDRLIFYYAGHGFHDGTTNFLTTYDTHTDNIGGTSVSLRNILLDPLKQSKCKNVIIFIDACAQIFQNDNARNLVSDINEEEFYMLRNDFPNYVTFLSCQTGEKSYSSDKLKNGIWTHHLIKALRGDIKKVLRYDKYVTDRSLSDYLSTSVSEYTETEHNRKQTPRAILDSSYENVIIERVM